VEFAQLAGVDEKRSLQQESLIRRRTKKLFRTPKVVEQFDTTARIALDLARKNLDDAWLSKDQARVDSAHLHLRRVLINAKLNHKLNRARETT
jgi:hypothetical protein